MTVTRVDVQRYWVITAAASERRDLTWLLAHARTFEVDVRNITEDYCVLGVMGPAARRALQPHTMSALTTELFPFATAKDIELAGITVRAARITYVGTLGWELYVPVANAQQVFDALMPMQLAGYHALDSLRIEKAYRHWGHDISDEDTPIEAGLSFTVAWEKADGFVGREALLEQRQRGVTKRLVLFELTDPEQLLYQRRADLAGRTHRRPDYIRRVRTQHWRCAWFRLRDSGGAVEEGVPCWRATIR